MAENSKLVADLKALKQKYFIPTEEIPEVKKPEVKQPAVILPKRTIPAAAVPQEVYVSQERLQEAVIWSEILGKPLSKRRHRR